jgi:hypothetical protein
MEAGADAIGMAPHSPQYVALRERILARLMDKSPPLAGQLESADVDFVR